MLVGVKLNSKPVHDEGVGDVLNESYHFYCDKSQTRYSVESIVFSHVNRDMILGLDIGDSVYIYIRKERSLSDWLNRDNSVYGMYSKKVGSILNHEEVIAKLNSNDENIIGIGLLLVMALWGLFRKNENPEDDEN